MSEILMRVFPEKQGFGWPKYGARAMRGTVVTLAEALTRRWPTDAYAVQYMADGGPAGALRLSVVAPKAGARVVLGCEFVDVDDPVTHLTGAPARDEWRAVESAKIQALRVDVPGVFAYDTLRGYRLVARRPSAYPIATAADAEAWRDVVARRLAWLSRRYGIVGDPTCHDWTRFMRLPHVVRDGVAQEHATVGDPHAVGEWPALDDADLDADLAELSRIDALDTARARAVAAATVSLAAAELAHAADATDATAKTLDAARKAAVKADKVKSTWNSHITRMRPPSRAAPVVRGARSRAVTSPPPSIAEIGPTARAVADALLALPRGGRHAVLQSIVGAALDAGWSRAHLDAFASELAAGLAGMRASSDPGEVSRLVDDSWRRRETGGAYRGRTSLRDEAPDVADALDAAIAAVSQARSDGMAYPATHTLREAVPGASLAVAADTRADHWRRDLDARPRPVEVSAAEAGATMYAAAGKARTDHAVMLLAATAGAGKTVAVCREAAEASRNGGVTALLAPSHTVARQMLSHLEMAGAVGVVHLHGLLALRDEAGDPVCKKSDAVTALMGAGLDAGEVACEGRHYGRRADPAQRHLPMVTPPTADSPCEHLDTCPAYAARQQAGANAMGALVLVTVHALAAVAAKWLDGKAHAMVVIDEAPPLIDAAAPTVAELRAAADRIDARRSAVARKETWRAAALRALADGTARKPVAEAPVVSSLRELLADGYASAVAVRKAERAKRYADDGDGALDADEGEPSAEARVNAWTLASERTITDAGPGSVRKRSAPRPSSRVRTGTMRAPDEHTADLAAVRLAGVVAAALVAEASGAGGVRVEVGARTRGDLSGAPEIRISVVNPALRALLTNASIGRILLDATADPRVLGAVLGAPVEVCRVDVADGAPVTRTFIPWAHGTRADCLPDGEVAWGEVASPLVEALAVASSHLTRGQSLAVFTWRPLARALAGTDDHGRATALRHAATLADAMDPSRAAADRGDLWAGAAATVERDALPRTVTTLPPMIADALADLDARGVRVTFSHYGHTRGRDDWKGADALLMLGSPWPDVAQVAQECAAVGLAAVAGDVGKHLAEAELEQACGRGRAPWRTTPLAIVVLATVPPKRADSRWTVRALAVGRPVRHDHTALAARAAVVGVREAAREAGCDRATVQRAVRRVGGLPLLVEGGGGAQPVSDIPPELCAPPTRVPLAPYEAPAIVGEGDADTGGRGGWFALEVAARWSATWHMAV